MQQLVRTTLELEQYMCDKCGRFFYINKRDKSLLDLDFGCPYGCDEAGIHTRTLKTEIKEVIEEIENSCENCRKCGETVCGGDTTGLSCYEAI